jgi:hypothetical protein
LSEGITIVFLEGFKAVVGFSPGTADMNSLPYSVLLLFLSQTLAIPVKEETQAQPVVKPEPVVEKLRQGGDDDDGPGELEAIGEQVSQIIDGVLTGNFGQIFGGSVGFIDDSDTQTGVGTILNGIELPVGALFNTALQQGQKYYNITGPPPILTHITTTTELPAPTPIVVQLDPDSLQPLDPLQLPNGQVVAPVTVQKVPVVQKKPAPVVVTVAPAQVGVQQQPQTHVLVNPPIAAFPVKTAAEDEDEDSDSDSDNSDAKLRRH